MKITDTQSIAKLTKLEGKSPAESRPDAPSPPSNTDRVTLSPEARELLAAQQKLAEIPDVREEKVHEIKARIANGSYRIDGGKIAEKMIREAINNKE